MGALQYHPPVTDFQLQLAAAWKKLLALEKISLKDNFFSLGGHSLLATQMLIDIKKEFAVDVPLRVVFQVKDFEGFSFHIENLVVSTKKEQGEVYCV